MSVLGSPEREMLFVTAVCPGKMIGALHEGSLSITSEWSYTILKNVFSEPGNHLHGKNTFAI